MRSNGFDLNLLLAFEALEEESSVSRAAERLHRSQPAMSAALDQGHLARRAARMKGVGGCFPGVDDMMRRCIDLSIMLENDVVTDPPFLRPTIKNPTRLVTDAS